MVIMWACGPSWRRSTGPEAEDVAWRPYWTTGRQGLASWPKVAAELTRRGYADRMVLAHDAACYFDWVDPKASIFTPNWHYLHIENDVLPALRERGVTDEQIDQMLIGNPRRYFENVTPY